MYHLNYFKIKKSLNYFNIEPLFSYTLSQKSSVSKKTSKNNNRQVITQNKIIKLYLRHKHHHPRYKNDEKRLTCQQLRCYHFTYTLLTHGPHRSAHSSTVTTKNKFERCYVASVKNMKYR